MKASLLALLLILPLVSFAGTPVQDLKNSPEKYDGRHVYVDCAHVRRQGTTSDGKSAIFHTSCYSQAKQQFGWIEVLVPMDEADAFARKYGSSFQETQTGSPVTKPLGGTFHVVSGYFQQPYIVYGSSSDSGSDESIFK
jgi:hypothetical protein